MNKQALANGASAAQGLTGRISMRWFHSVVGFLCIAYAAICLSDLPYFFFDSGPLHRVHLNHYVETTRAGISLHMLSVGPFWLVGLFVLQIILAIQLLRERDCFRNSLGLYLLVLSASNRAPFLFGAAAHYLALTCLGCAMLSRQSAKREFLLSILWMGQVLWASYGCLVLMGPVSLPSRYAPELLGLEAVVWIFALQKPHRWLRVASTGIGLALSAAMINAILPLNPSRVGYLVCLLLMRTTLWFFDRTFVEAPPPSEAIDSSSQVADCNDSSEPAPAESGRVQSDWDAGLVAAVVLACWTVLATCYTKPPLKRGTKVEDGTPAVVARELSVAFGLVQDWAPTTEPGTLICLASVRDEQSGAVDEGPFPETQWQQYLRSEHRCMLRKSNAIELNRGNSEYLRKVFDQLGSGRLESVRVVAASRELVYFRWNAKTTSNVLQDPVSPGDVR